MYNLEFSKKLKEVLDKGRIRWKEHFSPMQEKEQRHMASGKEWVPKAEEK